MKRKSAKKQIARCEPIFDEWLLKLGLKWWEINIDYCRDEKRFIKNNGKNVIMKCWVKWQYVMFDVDVNLTEIRRLSDAALESAIVHELCHALVSELRENDPDGKHEERVVTILTNAFIWVRNLTRNEKKKKE